MKKILLILSIVLILPLIGAGCSPERNSDENSLIKIEKCKTTSEVAEINTQTYVDEYNAMAKQYYSENGSPYPGDGVNLINKKIENYRKQIYLECLSR